jgi:ribonucleoside-triphosphate reductase
VPTINITKDFDWDSEVANKIFELSAKFGPFYFQNFIGGDIDPSDVRAMCCRIQLSLDDIRKHIGGIFGAGDDTGSIGIISLNLNRIGYETKTKKEFFKRLDYLLELAKTSLEIKRMIVEKNLENNLMPYTKRYLRSFDTYFSTIGVVGGNEMCLNFLGKDISDPESKKFMLSVLDHIIERTKDFQRETGNLWNCEASPCESAAFRLATADKKKYPDIITAGNGTSYLTNSSMLPVNHTDDLFEALDHQDELQCKYSSGSVHHVFLGEALPDGNSAKRLVKKIVENYHLPYFSITPTFSICPNHKYIKGEEPVCPICGERTEIYSRVVGYWRPVSSYNDGKRKEFADRKTYKIGGISDAEG